MAQQTMEHQHDDRDERKHAKASSAEPEGRSLGNFKLTHYTFALEKDPINAHSPKVHAAGLPHDKKYKQSFLDTKHGVGMQGTGLAEDGHHIMWTGNYHYAYGIGGSGGKPEAWKTVAVDTSVIPMGSHLEIETYKGKGIFVAKDTGGQIQGHHIDIFAGAIPIAEANQLGTKYSEVRLVKGGGGGGGDGGGGGGGGHHDGPKRSHDDPKRSHGGDQHHDGPAHHAQAPQHIDAGYRAAPTLEQARSGSAFIRRGCEGPSVKRIQEWVHVSADGMFGPITEGAVKEFQRRHGLEVDGVVGPHTMHAFDAHAPSHDEAHHPGHDEIVGGGGDGDSGGGQTDKPKHDTKPHHKPPKHHKPASGSDPVAIARRFLRNPPLPANSPYLLKHLPNYQAAGGATNDCADFVSSVLKTAGKISFHTARVVDMEHLLKTHGWHTVNKHEAQPGDVWLCASGGIQHVTLVSHSGGTKVIGANGSGVEHITEESIHYSGEIWLHKG